MNGTRQSRIDSSQGSSFVQASMSHRLGQNLQKLAALILVVSLIASTILAYANGMGYFISEEGIPFTIIAGFLVLTSITVFITGSCMRKKASIILNSNARAQLKVSKPILGGIKEASPKPRSRAESRAASRQEVNSPRYTKTVSPYKSPNSHALPHGRAEHRKPNPHATLHPRKLIFSPDPVSGPRRKSAPEIFDISEDLSRQGIASPPSAHEMLKSPKKDAVPKDVREVDAAKGSLSIAIEQPDDFNPDVPLQFTAAPAFKPAAFRFHRMNVSNSVVFHYPMRSQSLSLVHPSSPPSKPKGLADSEKMPSPVRLEPRSPQRRASAPDASLHQPAPIDQEESDVSVVFASAMTLEMEESPSLAKVEVMDTREVLKKGLHSLVTRVGEYLGVLIEAENALHGTTREMHNPAKDAARIAGKKELIGAAMHQIHQFADEITHPQYLIVSAFENLLSSCEGELGLAFYRTARSFNFGSEAVQKASLANFQSRHKAFLAYKYERSELLEAIKATTLSKKVLNESVLKEILAHFKKFLIGQKPKDCPDGLFEDVIDYLLGQVGILSQQKTIVDCFTSIQEKAKSREDLFECTQKLMKNLFAAIPPEVFEKIASSHVDVIIRWGETELNKVLDSFIKRLRDYEPLLTNLRRNQLKEFEAGVIEQQIRHACADVGGEDYALAKELLLLEKEWNEKESGKRKDEKLKVTVFAIHADHIKPFVKKSIIEHTFKKDEVVFHIDYHAFLKNYKHPVIDCVCHSLGDEATIKMRANQLMSQYARAISLQNSKTHVAIILPIKAQAKIRDLSILKSVLPELHSVFSSSAKTLIADTLMGPLLSIFSNALDTGYPKLNVAINNFLLALIKPVYFSLFRNQLASKDHDYMSRHYDAHIKQFQNLFDMLPSAAGRGLLALLEAVEGGENHGFNGAIRLLRTISAPKKMA